MDVTNSHLAQELREIELGRLRSLVEVRMAEAMELHAADFSLVHPSGGEWSREQYLGGIASGQIDYRRFEAVSEIEVMASGDVAVLRYRSIIDIAVAGQDAGILDCWHLDCYWRDGDGRWRVRWSQATEIA